MYNHKILIRFVILHEFPENFIHVDVLKRERNGLTEKEFELLRKYRLLNDHGKYVVEALADIEYDRMLAGLEQKKSEQKRSL